MLGVLSAWAHPSLRSGDEPALRYGAAPHYVRRPPGSIQNRFPVYGIYSYIHMFTVEITMKKYYKV